MVTPDREGFRLWLVSKDPDERVGTRRSPGWCPLARWIRETVGASEVCVSGTHPDDLRVAASFRLTPSGPQRHVQLPWANAFGLAIDRDRRSGQGGVTAKEALTLLDSLELA